MDENEEFDLVFVIDVLGTFELEGDQLAISDPKRPTPQTTLDVRGGTWQIYTIDSEAEVDGETFISTHAVVLAHTDVPVMSISQDLIFEWELIDPLETDSMLFVALAAAHYGGKNPRNFLASIEEELGEWSIAGLEEQPAVAFRVGEEGMYSLYVLRDGDKVVGVAIDIDYLYEWVTDDWGDEDDDDFDDDDHDHAH